MYLIMAFRGRYWFIGLCVSFSVSLLVLSACTQAAMTTPEQSLSVINTDTPTPKPIATKTATATLQPTDTVTPTATFTATVTPTITPTPLPWADEIITADNVSDLKMLASWGRGTVLERRETADNRLIVRSTLGIYLYQTERLNLLAHFPGAVRYLVSPDESLLALVYADNTAQIIRLDDGKLLHEFVSNVTVPAFICDGCNRSTQAGYIFRSVLSTALAFSENNKFFALGYVDTSIGVWNLEDGSLYKRLYHDVSGQPEAIVFSDDLTYLLSSGRQLMSHRRKEIVSYFSLESGELRWYQLAAGRFAPELFSPDGNLWGVYFQAAGAREDVIRLYRIKDGQLVGEIKGKATFPAFCPDGRFFISTQNTQVLVWQVQPTFQLSRTLYPKGEVNSAHFSADGSRLLINEGEFIYTAEDFSLTGETQSPQPTPTPTELVTLKALWNEGHIGEARDLHTLPDNHLFVWGGNYSAWRWDPLGDRITYKLFLGSGRNLGVADVSADGKIVATCFEDRLAVSQFYGEDITTMPLCLEDDVVKFLPTDPFIARARNTQVKLFNWQTGETVQDYLTQGYKITWLEFSADGQMMAAGGEVCGYGGCIGDIHLWQVDPARGVSLALDGSEHSVSDVAFTSDHTLMFAAKQSIWAWDTNTGLLRGRFPGSGSVLAISPDDQLLAIGYYDGHIEFVSIVEKKLLGQVYTQQGAIRKMTFSEDGANLITLGSDGTVRAWGIP